MEYQRTRADIDSAVYRHALELAEAQGRDEREMLDELLEESVRMRRFPGIVFRGGPAGRRAHVFGTGLDVWQIIEGYEGIASGASRRGLDEGDPRDLNALIFGATSTGKITDRDLDLALAYRAAYPEEIDRLVEGNSRPPGWWRERRPLPDEHVREF